MIFDGVDVEEAGVGDMRLFEERETGSVRGLVGEEPGGAQRDGAWAGAGAGGFGWRVFG